MANEKNLKGPLSPEEAREQGRKGGIASGKARRRKANLRKAMEAALLGEVTFHGEKMTAEEAMCLRMIEKALKTGNVEAYKAAMATMGRSRSELDEKEQRARIKRMEVETERAKAEVEALKLKIEAGADIVDDGFLDALSGSAAEDWANED